MSDEEMPTTGAAAKLVVVKAEVDELVAEFMEYGVQPNIGDMRVYRLQKMLVKLGVITEAQEIEIELDFWDSIRLDLRKAAPPLREQAAAARRSALVAGVDKVDPRKLRGGAETNHTGRLR